MVRIGGWVVLGVVGILKEMPGLSRISEKAARIGQNFRDSCLD